MRDKLVYLSTSEEAVEVYKDLRDTLQASGLQLRSSLPPQARHLGSAPLQQVRHTRCTLHSTHFTSSTSSSKAGEILRRVLYFQNTEPSFVASHCGLAQFYCQIKC